VIDHVSTYTTNFATTRAFYDAALGALGYERNVDMSYDDAGRTWQIAAYGKGRKPTLWLIESAVPYTGRHIAFVAPDRAGVDAFYGAGIAAGGADNGSPGLRPHYHADYYGAFLFDPDGNNVEAVFHGPA